MQRASEYRRHAEECRQLAATAGNDHRKMFLRMAETWDMLADERKAQVERQQWIDKLEKETNRP